MPSAGTGKIATKLGLCLCAGTLIAGPLMASAAEAAPTAITAKVSPTVTPTVQESANTTKAKAGTLVRVHAKVIDPRTGVGLRNQTVRLQYRANAAWHLYDKAKTNSAGQANFLIHPSKSLILRSLYSGSGKYRQANSKQITIKVTQSSKGAAILAEAKKHTGALYLYAAAGPSRFDCSGYTMYVYRKAVGKSRAQVGDLIIFRTGSYGYHAAIYAGGGYMYDSPHTGARVGKHKIFSSSYVVRRLA
jgi:peptidoglycan DL-endopeptidase CwlO